MPRQTVDKVPQLGFAKQHDRVNETTDATSGQMKDTKLQRKSVPVRQLAEPAPAAASFSCDFEFDNKDEFYAVWNVIDVDNDGVTWEFNDYDFTSKVASIKYDVSNDLNDYLVTANPVQLESGDAYVYFERATYGSDWTTEKLEVMYGSTPNVEEMQVLQSYEFYTDRTLVETIIPFNIPESGEYYFAFHATSEAFMYGIYIDNVEINNGTYAASPDIVLVGVTLPLPSSSLSNSEKVIATVANQGKCDIASYDLQWTVSNGESKQTGPAQTVSTPLAVGDMKAVELTSPLDLSSEGTYQVTVTATNIKPAAGGKDEIKADNNSYTTSTVHFATTDVPFNTDFTDGEQNERWASDDSWMYESQYYKAMACVGYSPLLSCGINLEAGKSYRIKYSYMAGSYLYGIIEIPESFTILCGLDGSDVESMTLVSETTDAFTDEAFVNGEATFDCDQTGIYQFAFLQDSPQGSLFLQRIDITEIADYDVAITGTSIVPSMLPLPQTGNISTEVTVTNKGVKNCNATLTVSLNGTTLASAKYVDLAAGTASTQTVTYDISETAAANATAEIVMTVAIDGQTDADETDNTKSTSILLTDDILAYDHATQYDFRHTVGSTAGSLIAGIPITMSADDVLTGISVGWSEANDQEILLAVYRFDPSDKQEMEGYQYYIMDDPIYSATVKQGTEIGQIDYKINPRALKAGESYMICVGVDGECLVADFVNPGMLYSLAGNYAVDQSSANLGTPAIRCIFGDGIATARNLTVNGIVSPDGERLYTSNQPITVSVTNNGSETADGSLAVTVNGTELEPQSVTLQSYATGTYTFVADMATPGDYTIVATATLDGDEDMSDNRAEKTVTSAEPLDPYMMDFEGCADFTTEGFNPAWTTVDGDGAEIYGLEECSFPVAADYTCSFMAFNPYATTPSLANQIPSSIPHSGNRYGLALAAYAAVNDDWLISPLLTMPETEASMKMYVQSLSSLYGLEDYEVCVSTTDNNPESFTAIHTAQAPAGEWSEVNIDLSDYNGQNIYVAIHYNASDKLAFMVDDIEITRPTSGVSDNLANAALTLYPNPASEAIIINAAGQEIESVAIYSMAGALVGAVGTPSDEIRYNVSGLATGIYFAKVKTATGMHTLKFVKK